MTLGDQLKLGWLRQVLVGLSCIGFLLFAALFATTYANKGQLEHVAQSFITSQIKSDLAEKYPTMANGDIPEKLNGIQEKYSNQGDRLKLMMDAKIDMLIADSISNLCGSNCAKKDAWRQSIHELFEKKFERANQASETLKMFIQGKYTETLAKLLQDIRIFSGANTVAFVIVVLVLILKHGARVHLVVPSALLILSALVSIYLYVFQQNWFFTFIHGSYWGYGYALYMAVIFGFLLDIVLNNGRVITGLLNSLGGVSIPLC